MVTFNEHLYLNSHFIFSRKKFGVRKINKISRSVSTFRKVSFSFGCLISSLKMIIIIRTLISDNPSGDSYVTE